MATVQKCLSEIGVDLASLADCAEMNEQWMLVKKLRQCLLRKMCQRFAKLYSRVVARTCTWHTFIPTTLQAYFKKVLATHPDKGGDAAEFRALQAAFEVLRSMVDKGKVTSFTASRKQSTQKAYNKSFEGFEVTMLRWMDNPALFAP
eukprot:365069-Chlamydomonas_euryale.AAC.12